MTTKAHTHRTLLGITLMCAFIVSGLMPSAVYGAGGKMLAIVDANGYISPRTQVEADTKADVSISGNNSDKNSLLQATGSANTQIEFGTTAKDYTDGTSDAAVAKQAETSGDFYTTSEEEGFFTRLKLWGRMVASFFGLGTAKVLGDAEVNLEPESSPKVTTSSSTAIISWSESPSLVARVYFSSTSPVTTSPESSYVTVWGMTRQEAELDGLLPNTTYYYRIVPVGLGVTASSSNEFSFTTLAQ